MKLTCDYCGTLFDDIHATCPHCGAPNQGVLRKSGDQPITIDELKLWYSSKGLPPYETTRFFIGEDYQKPRAFGIYKKEDGTVVVYKNKDSGERAIRYEGTDEAYAVNELFQRLKEEIIQQKKAALKRAPTRSASPSGSSSASPAKSSSKKQPSGCLRFLLKLILIPVALAVLLFIASFIWVILENAPDRGYYEYENAAYYYYVNEDNTTDKAWFEYLPQNEDWSGELTKEETPELLRKNKNAKHYFVSEHFPNRLHVSDFLKSRSFADHQLAYADEQNHHEVSTGYYQYDGSTYYHLYDSYDEGWYLFDNGEWSDVSVSTVPEDLQHQTLAEDFYYTPKWDSSTQITDFTDSSAYQDTHTSYSNSSYDSDDSSWDNSSWNDDDDDDSFWSSSWDDNNSWSGSDWDSGSSDWGSDW